MQIGQLFSSRARDGESHSTTEEEPRASLAEPRDCAAAVEAENVGHDAGVAALPGMGNLPRSAQAPTDLSQVECRGSDSLLTPEVLPLVHG